MPSIFMHLPDPLQRALAQAIDQANHAELAAAAESVSQRYRSTARPRGAAFLTNDDERLAYAATRLPATYAANSAVINQLGRRWPDAAFSTLLDLGAGSGSASWAACTLLSSLQSVTLIERDPRLVALGQRLAAAADLHPMNAALWQTQALQEATLPTSDLVIASYVLNELAADECIDLVGSMWQATSQALVLIEPGTTPCFNRLQMLRSMLLEQGGYLLAPCPHTHACPLAADDWCHFAQRVSRSTQHRLFKRGDLGYEDEKFFYLIFTRTEQPRAAGRIVRHPQRRSGHVHLRVCQEDGLRDAVVSRRDGPAWKAARKVQWGDAWQPGPSN